MTDLDQSGHGFQRVRTYLGPSLGWKDELVKPSTDIITGGIYNVQPGDSLLLVDFAGAVTINLPDVVKWVNQTADQPATGFERSITVKDIGGNAHSFNILVTPFGEQAIDDVQQSVLIQEARGTLKLLPLNDLTGWVVETTGGSGSGGGGTGDVTKAGNNTYTGLNTFTNTTRSLTEPDGENSTKVATTAYVQNNLVNYQPLDADLSSIAALTGVGVIYFRSAPSTWTAVTIGANLTFSGGTLSATGGGGGAPTTAEYITSTPDATLTAERVITDSATITWDRTVAGQIKANTAAGGGNVSNVGTPTNGQLAQWVTATTIQGISDAIYARVASPTFTGDPKAPTPVVTDNDTSIATTAYVQNNLVNYQPLDGDLTALSALLGTNTIYYRSAADVWSPVTFSGLSFSGGILTVTAGGGNVSAVPTPVADQIAVWTDATHIKGVSQSGLNLAMQNYIAGLGLSNASDTVNDINVVPGQAADSTNVQMMTLPASITKQFDVAWAQGNNQGGRDASSAWVDGTWHIFLIWGTGNVVDVIASINVAPVLPSPYVYFRRIGSIIRKGGTIVQFRQNGNNFILSVPSFDFSTTALGNSRQLQPLTVPTNINPIALLRVDASHASGSLVVICDPLEPDVIPSGTASPGITIRGAVSGQAQEIQTRTDSNGQVAARANTGSTTLRITTLGWVDSRGSGSQETGSSLLAQNGFRADKGGTNQTIASGTATKVTFPNVAYDAGSYYDVANSRWRPPAGLVHIDASVDFSAGITANSAIFAMIYKNGATFSIGRMICSTTNGSSQISADDKADGNDYYEIWTTITSGGSATLDGTNTPRTFFTAHVPGGQAGPPGPMGAQGPAGTPGLSGSEFSTGDVKLTLKTVPDTNWLMMDDGFIGNATSGASSLAGIAAQNLFTLLFNNVADAQCPIQTNTGAATTRAAQTNASTAWGNSCRMQLPKVLGRAMSGAGQGGGLTNRVLAQFGGAETFTQTTSTLPAHSHTTGAVGVSTASSDVAVMQQGAAAQSTNNIGSGSAHAIVQPTVYLNVMIRL